MLFKSPKGFVIISHELKRNVLPKKIPKEVVKEIVKTKKTSNLKVIFSLYLSKKIKIVER